MPHYQIKPYRPDPSEPDFRLSDNSFVFSDKIDDWIHSKKRYQYQRKDSKRKYERKLKNNEI